MGAPQEREAFERAMAQAMQSPQGQSVQPAMMYFWPCFYQAVNSLVAADGKSGQFSPADVVEKAYSYATAAFGKMGFDLVPPFGFKQKGTSL